jgi:Kef-type K+ transport system membrane component KefB
MNGTILIGIIIIAGFIFGELANKIKLPKVTGYIVAGILLSPDIASFVPESFVKHTDIVTNISLGIITFSVGGTLLISKIKSMGKQIMRITLMESSMAFLFVIAGFVIATPFFLNIENATYFTIYIPFSLMLGSLAAPTDPTATLAVSHEYQAKGKVMSSIMGVAAFDDAFGIVLYSIAIAFASSLVSPENIGYGPIAVNIVKEIFGALIIGAVVGFLFNKITRFISDGAEGIIIVLVVGFLALCFGLSHLLEVDELLANLFMGFIVVNFNKKSQLIFGILERYTEQLIFVLFFTISGMHLDIFVLGDYFLLVLLFILFRGMGKFLGAYTGAGKTDPKIKKYTAGGLIPQGGIVIGLALMIKQNPDFSMISDEFINIILGATVIHELIGPVLAKISLKKAGEIKTE